MAQIDVSTTNFIEKNDDLKDSQDNVLNQIGESTGLLNVNNA